MKKRIQNLLELFQELDFIKENIVIFFICYPAFNIIQYYIGISIPFIFQHIQFYRNNMIFRNILGYKIVFKYGKQQI